MTYWVGIFCEEVCNADTHNCCECMLARYDTWMETGGKLE